MLSGFKTYIAAAMTVIGAIAAWLSGEATIIEMFQLIVPAIVGAFVRLGVAKG